MVNFASALSAGTLVHCETDDGENLLTFTPSKSYQSVVFSSPGLTSGDTCAVYTGGSATGTVTDGLYSSVTYTAGTQYTSFTISDIVTGSGAGGGGMMPPGGGMMPGGGGRRR
jgi:hypothetical protein